MKVKNKLGPEPFPIRRCILINALRDSMKNNLLSGGKKSHRLMSRLLIRHFYLIRNEPEFTQEICLQVICRMLKPNSVLDLPTKNSEDIWEEHLLKHNIQVAYAFLKAGINCQVWQNFDEVSSSEADEFEKMDNPDRKWAELNVALSYFLKEFSGATVASSIRKDIIGIQKRKNEIICGKSPRLLTDGTKAIFQKTVASINYLNKKGVNHKLPKDFFEELHTLAWEIRKFSRKPIRKKFFVKLWSRGFFDIFQGNFSDCCVGVGLKKSRPAVKLPGVSYKEYPAGIFNYLTDLGIQVAEILDGEKMVRVGQCWLFVALDDHGLPMLVADSFDLGSDYAKSISWKNAIRGSMFDFLNKYASASGINKVILGDLGPELQDETIHRIHNDIRVDDLDEVSFREPIEKLGGYFLDRPYFLESRGGTRAFLVHQDERAFDPSLDG